ncbi:MAG TPA: GNAT family N-acetyltransferase [Sphingomonas sp.]|nr:GNAT family N-acetyltransferase [Sphingomonas sp.]
MTGHELIDGVPADLDEVMATMELAFDPVFGEAWTRAQCAGIMCLNGVWLTLARAGGIPAGFALARAVADEAELLLLAVRPGRRGGGVGGALLRSVETRAHALGAARLHLEMREGNPAGALYARHGFAQVGRRSRYYRGRDGRVFDAITLSRPLDGRE